MLETKPKLFLLDAYALIYRAYYAFIKNPRINSKGLNTSAQYGFTNTLIEVLQKEKPTHIAVVFDLPGKVNREDLYANYKANREETPDDIKSAIPHIKQIIEGFNIPVIGLEGYEADDVIGTLAKKAEKEGFETFMMTPDKDFAQLVSKNIFIYKPARLGNAPEILGIPEVCAKFEITDPKQVIDILGLWGDAVDNIPGVPGVGEKTAKKFVRQYGSLEGLYENIADLKGKMKEKVEANQEQAILSKVLATIITDAPVHFDAEALKVEEPNKEALKKVFSELEFRRLAERLLGEAIVVPTKKTSSAQNSTAQMDMFANSSEEPEEALVPIYKTIETTQHEYILIDDEQKRKGLIEELQTSKEFCFDTETTNLNQLEAELIGLAFSMQKGKAYYVVVPEDKTEIKKIIAEFTLVFENESTLKIAHNYKYDLAILKNYGVEVKGKFFDTMLAHYLIAPDMRHNMDVLAETYLNYKPVSIETLIGKKGKNQKSMRDVELNLVKEYAAEDADITFQLKQVFAPLLEDTGTQKIFEEIELPLVSVLESMEREGVKLDIPALREYSEELREEIIGIEKEIYEYAGVEFNIASPKQLGEVLFDRMQISSKPKKTKSGQYATSEEVLTKLMNNHPIVQNILDYRSLSKLKSTYVDALPDLVSTASNRLHTTYNQAVAATGRLSSVSPNLQNIPIRTSRGKEVRKAFVPRDENHVLVAADYSQIELRIIADLSGDKGMQKAFINKEDIHTTTASKIYDVATEEVTKDMRRNAKMVNFGIVYGISAFGLSQRLNIPRTEAKHIITQYFEKYPGVKFYMDSMIDFARKNGYVETILGRRRYLKDINSRNAIVRGHAERNAINAPIQGSAADLIKIAMIKIDEVFKAENLSSKMILQVHDELIFDTHKKELNLVETIIKKEMIGAINMAVPLEVRVDKGDDWLSAH